MQCAVAVEGELANHIKPGGWIGELEFLQGAEREGSTTTSVTALGTQTHSPMAPQKAYQ